MLWAHVGGEVNAKVAARALAASFCALVSTGEPAKTVGRSDLRAMKEPRYQWPSVDTLEPSRFPGLAKAIANYFMLNLLNPNNLELIGGEARQVVDYVSIMLRIVLLTVF